MEWIIFFLTILLPVAVWVGIQIGIERERGATRDLDVWMNGPDDN